MKSNDVRILRRRKRKLQRRLARKQSAAAREKHATASKSPVLQGGNIHYQVSQRVRAVHGGGIAAIHRMVQGLGLHQEINSSLPLLKRHVPYFESDHVLTIPYSILNGGECLQDIDYCRGDEAFLDLLQAQRIPDPTTSGDFLRRFKTEQQLLSLMNALNRLRRRLWMQRLSPEQRRLGKIDIDGTICSTYGQTLEGMDMSYKGLWGYAPLLVSLANTKEPLFIVNRPGSAPSNLEAAEWTNRTLGLVEGVFERILMRGDSDFSQSKHLDGWDDLGWVEFVFGWDACPNLVKLAKALEESLYGLLERKAPYEIKTKPRKRPINHKEKAVRRRRYKNIRLRQEHVAEFEYRPTACNRSYRMVVLRKSVSVYKGKKKIEDKQIYFFYITNNRKMSAREVIEEANERCDQENLISQLSGQVHALRPMSNTLESNWAWMVIASLAWTFKSWFALMAVNALEQQAILRMEFKRFVREFIMISCQVVRTAGQLLCRVLEYKPSVEVFLRTFHTIRGLRPMRC